MSHLPWLCAYLINVPHFPLSLKFSLRQPLHCGGVTLEQEREADQSRPSLCLTPKPQSRWLLAPHFPEHSAAGPCYLCSIFSCCDAPGLRSAASHLYLMVSRCAHPRLHALPWRQQTQSPQSRQPFPRSLCQRPERRSRSPGALETWVGCAKTSGCCLCPSRPRTQAEPALEL